MTRAEEMRSFVEAAIDKLEHGQTQAALNLLRTALDLDTVQAARALGIAPAFHHPELVFGSRGSYLIHR